MPKIEIHLSDAMFEELQDASGRVCEKGFSPETFAAECVEVVLASRRLRRIAPGKIGARMQCADPCEIERYRVAMPDRSF